MAETAEKDGGSGKRRTGSIVTWVIAGVVLFAFYESIVLLIIGMAPTGVAMLFDRSPSRNQTRTVGYLNFAGCLPWVIDYWLVGGDFARVFDIFADPMALFVMYSSAALGWLLYFAIRPIVGSYLAVSAEIKEKQIGRVQGKMEEEWGPEIRKDAEERTADPADGEAAATAPVAPAATASEDSEKP